MFGFVELDPEVARELAIAIGRRVATLNKQNAVVHPQLLEIGQAAYRASTSSHERSRARSRRVTVQPEPDGVWMTTADVAELVDVHESTVRRWTSSNCLPSTKLGRVRRIRRDDLTRFLEQGKERTNDD